MRGRVKRRCPAPKPGQSGCRGKTCAHLYALWLDQPRGEDGKRRQITRSGFETKEEAERALAKALTDVEDSTFTRPDASTVAMHLSTWLAGLDRKPATIEAYRRVVHLAPGTWHRRWAGCGCSTSRHRRSRRRTGRCRTTRAFRPPPCSWCTKCSARRFPTQ